MSPTAFTALILTFHHASVFSALIVAILLSTMIFWLFIKRRKNRLPAALLTFLLTLILGISLAEGIYERKPIDIEVVQAG